MARKKKHEEHVNHERWLVSYADFITLLFATFTALFAISNADKEKFADMARSLKNAFSTTTDREVTTIRFGGIGSDANDRMGFIDVFENEGATPHNSISSLIVAAGSVGSNMIPSRTPVTDDLAEDESEILPAPPIEGQTGPDQSNGGDTEFEGGGPFESAHPRGNWLPQLSTELRDVIETTRLDQSVNLRTDPRGLVVSLSEASFFENESTFVKPESIEKLNRIIELLRQEGHRLQVEGHSDNSPLQSGRFESHLELTTLRASKLAAWMRQRYDFPPGAVTAAGYGSDVPIADNETQLGRMKNRRVDIVVLNPEKTNSAG